MSAPENAPAARPPLAVRGLRKAFGELVALEEIGRAHV